MTNKAVMSFLEFFYVDKHSYKYILYNLCNSECYRKQKEPECVILHNSTSKSLNIHRTYRPYPLSRGLPKFHCAIGDTKRLRG